MTSVVEQLLCITEEMKHLILLCCLIPVLGFSQTKSVQFQYPMAGATWEPGSMREITWTASNIDSVVLAYRVTGASTSTLIANSIPGANGSYSWTIPVLQYASGNIPVTLSIHDKNDSAISDTAEVIIHIERSLQLTYPGDDPNVSYSFLRGVNVQLDWFSVNVDSVKIELQTAAGGPYKTLGTAAATDRRFNWRVTEPVTQSARLRISDLQFPAIKSETPNTFSIRDVLLSILTPAEGRILKGNQNFIVMWNRESLRGQVKVSFKYPGGPKTSIESTNLDYVVWHVPDTTVNNVTLYTDEEWFADIAASDSVIVHIEKSQTTGLYDVLHDDAYNIYPNPSEGIVHVAMAKGKQVQVNVYDLSGRNVLSTVHSRFELTQPGMYLVQVISDQGSAYRKILIR